MAQDLLILKLLKIPVIIIKFFGNSFAIMTYLPNYLIFLIFDLIAFSRTLVSTSLAYILSWPIRLASILSIIVIFCWEFYSLYQLLKIDHFHWGIQTLMMIVVLQICLALMRKGYLSMIDKFNPKKLKSPYQHAEQLLFFITDLICLPLILLNIVLIVNISSIWSYKYNQNTKFGYLKYMIKQTNISILKIIQLFYIKIFFRIFSWRYEKSLKQIIKEEQECNTLNLFVLLTLLFLGTILDLGFILVFGLYCYYIHPRKNLCWKKNKQEYRRYRVVLWFLGHSILQILEICILVFCLPFKYHKSKKLMIEIKDNKQYKHNYLPDTLFVLKLASLKIPSLLCQLILLISIYKYKKMKILVQQAAVELDQYEKNKKKGEKYCPMPSKYCSRQYISFRCLGSLIKQIPMFPIILINSLMKIHNLGWMKYILTERYDIRKEFVGKYLKKNIIDYLMVLPALLSTFILLIYDPIKVIRNLKIIKYERLKKKKQIESIYFKQYGQDIEDKNYQKMFQRKTQFYSVQAAIMPKISALHFIQIKKDIFMIPLFICTRLSCMSLMKCPHPESSVQLFQFLLMLYYIRRIKKNSEQFQLFTQILKKDEAAGLIKTSRHRLRFWKFACKASRHRIISIVLSHLMPKKLAEKTIVNAKIEKNYSAIANHYWHRYNITIALIKSQIFFIVELIVSLIGVLIMMPLTLWRMPTFFILLKKMKYAKYAFFPILFKIYKQMFLDILTIPIKSFIFITCPLSMFRFYKQNIFVYGVKPSKQDNQKPKMKQILGDFEKIEKLKIQYLYQIIFGKSLKTFKIIWKICLIKVLWVRKRDMNYDLQSSNLKIRSFFKQVIKTKEYIPTVQQLLTKGIGAINFNNKPITAKISDIIDIYYPIAIEDLPYLSLMIVIFITLPWRIFYISQSLLLMREDPKNRRQFLKLLKKIAQDYKCLVLYIILLLSIVRTRRTLYLIWRNIKLNFYVGFLKYSHLNQLKSQLIEAGKFYRSFGVLLVAIIISPFRMIQILKKVFKLYKTYRQEQNEKKALEQMHQNTVKQGKQQQILDKIGHQVLLNVFEYLDTKQLAKMSSVSRYMYEVVRERDQSWIEHWQRIYQKEYQKTVVVKDQYGDPIYYQMCRKAYELEKKKGGAPVVDKNRFYALACQQYFKSATSQHLSLKDYAQTNLKQSLFTKLFTSLRYTPQDGYGPQQQWPQPDDNEEFLTLMNIQRRTTLQLSQQNAYASWFLERPTQFIIVRLNRFFNVNEKRRLKQVIYTLIRYPGVIAFYLSYLYLWPFFWVFSPYIGLKILFIGYYTAFFFIINQRFQIQSRNWASLTPFDLTEDIKILFRKIRDWVNLKSTQLARQINRLSTWTSNKTTQGWVFIRDKIIKKYIIRPLKWLLNKFIKVIEMFLEKVVHPLYISVSNKLRALWRIINAIFSFTLQGFKFIFNSIKNVILAGFKALMLIASGISAFYQSILQNSLRFALSFGPIGELIFTFIVLIMMFSPSIICYYYFSQRWFIIMSTLLTMILIVTGYKHLSRIKNQVLGKKK